MAHDRTSLNEKGSRRHRFGLMAWLTLLVVVLSAAPSHAQPRTRMVGSAFDPAAVSVALSPASRLIASAVAAAKDKKRPDPGVRAIAAAIDNDRDLPATAASGPLPESERLLADLREARSRLGPSGARAPPLG